MIDVICILVVFVAPVMALLAVPFMWLMDEIDKTP